MASTRTRKPEGEDRQVERTEISVGYTELPKPELEPVRRKDLTEGFRAVSLGAPRYFTEESARSTIDSRIRKSAAVTSSETYYLWHPKSGRLYERELSPGPWTRALAQRNAGFRRFAGTAVQTRPGVGRTSEDLLKYVVRSNVQEDGRFDTDADYLGATDQLSDPLDGEADPELTAGLLEAVFGGTERHDGFESLVLGRPSRNRTQMDHLTSILSDQPADAPHGQGIRLEGPDDPAAGFFEMMEGSGNGEEPEPRLELSRFRGTLPNIPGLEGCEWVRLEVTNRTAGQQEFLEAVATGIGNGARVFVEGYHGKPQVLVPIKLGFAG